MDVPRRSISMLNDFDFEAMRRLPAALSRRAASVVLRTWILYVALGVFGVVAHRPLWWMWTLFGLAFFGVRCGPMPRSPQLSARRFAVFGDGARRRCCVPAKSAAALFVRGIRAINDIGEQFVLVPAFGKRLVFPKRSFPDGGREARHSSPHTGYRRVNNEA